MINKLVTADHPEERKELMASPSGPKLSQLDAMMDIWSEGVRGRTLLGIAVNCFQQRAFFILVFLSNDVTHLSPPILPVSGIDFVVRSVSSLSQYNVVVDPSLAALLRATPLRTSRSRASLPVLLPDARLIFPPPHIGCRLRFLHRVVRVVLPQLPLLPRLPPLFLPY